MATEIKIRGLDPATIKVLDRYAAQRGLSRNAYLTVLLTGFTAEKEAESYVARYELLAADVTAALRKNTDALQRFLHEVEEET